jgi:hypothetical protein
VLSLGLVSAPGQAWTGYIGNPDQEKEGEINKKSPQVELITKLKIFSGQGAMNWKRIL